MLLLEVCLFQAEGTMNRNGQLGKILSAPIIILLVALLLAGLIGLVSVIPKPQKSLEIYESSVSEEVFSEKIKIMENEKEENISILHALVKYQKDVPAGAFSGGAIRSEGFDKKFEEGLAKFLLEKSFSKNATCVAFSVEQGTSKKRIFIMHDSKLEGKYEVKDDFSPVGRKSVLNVLTNEGVNAGGLSDKGEVQSGDVGAGSITISEFVNVLSVQLGEEMKVDKLPFIEVEPLEGEKERIYYYYGGCKGGGI